MNYLIYAPAVIVAISVLVVFHEMGHYWVARLCGVKILRFSVGFGKVLYARHIGRGETEWAISAIPLGGYVKMLDEREGEVAPHELGRAFNRKPVLQRVAIVVAGPLANLLLAVILYSAMFMHGVPGLKAVVGEVPPQTPAAAAQFQAHELIVSVNGEAVPGWDEVRWALLKLALQRGRVEIGARTPDGVLHQHLLDLSQITPADLNGDFMRKLGLKPYLPQAAPIADRVLAGSVAERAGLRAGDKVLRVDGQEIRSFDQWAEVVRSHPEVRLHLEIEREGRPMAMDITPEKYTEAGKTMGRVGVAAPPIDPKLFEALMTEVSYPPLAALGQAFSKTWDISALSLKMLGRMVTGEVSVKNLSGPVQIAKYAGETAALGLGAYLSFLAFFSVNLGVLNLLPVPILDGGHLLYYIAEFFKGRPVSEWAWELGQKIGAVLLASLLVIVLYNDLSSLISG